jgi:hypothetical protein
MIDRNDAPMHERKHLGPRGLRIISNCLLRRLRTLAYPETPVKSSDCRPNAAARPGTILTVRKRSCPTAIKQRRRGAQRKCLTATVHWQKLISDASDQSGFADRNKQWVVTRFKERRGCTGSVSHVNTYEADIAVSRRVTT